jgi:hypothetical protein
MNCPGCHSRHDLDVDTITDTRRGLVVVAHGDQPTYRHRCPCGRSWTVTSNGALITPAHLTLIEGAA